MKRLAENIAGYAFMFVVVLPWAMWRRIRGKGLGDWVP